MKSANEIAKEIAKEMVLLLDDYQQELWAKFGKGKISNYEWRSPELWDAYAIKIALFCESYAQEKVEEEREANAKLSDSYTAKLIRSRTKKAVDG